MKYFFILFLIALNVFKMFIARYFPLIGDEGYYFLWSKHLDLSYFDHPPMIAYINFLLNLAFGNSEFAIRLSAIATTLTISLMIYKIGEELFNRRCGIISAVIFNLLPTFFGGGIFLVPQQLLMLFWVISIYLFIKIIITKKSRYWYFLGVSAGLGLLSDYVMAAFFLSTGFYLLLNRAQRFWFFRKEPYLAALVSMLLFSPVIIWNIKYPLSTVFYWGAKMGMPSNIFDNLIYFFGLQMLLYTPVVFGLTMAFLFYYFYKSYQEQDQDILLLCCLSVPLFLVFFLLVPVAKVGGHWLAAAYLPAIIFLGAAAKRNFTILVSSTLFFVILVNSLVFIYFIFLYPTPAELKGREFIVNQQLSWYLKEVTPPKGKTYVLATNMGLAGLIAFHGKTEVYMAPGRIKQFDLWGKPDIKKGDNLIYFALNEEHLGNALKPLFKTATPDPQKRIFTKDSDIPQKTIVFICQEYRGGNIP